MPPSMKIFASEAFGSLQCRLDVGDGDVEDGMARVARSASDAATDAAPILGGDEVQESVASRFRYLPRDRRRRIELPAEELAEVRAEPLRVLADDLKVHNWL